jgi:hypothetical protein
VVAQVLQDSFGLVHASFSSSRTNARTSRLCASLR